MQIKQSALLASLNQRITPVYLLIGADAFLMHESAHLIKRTWRAGEAIEEHAIKITDAADWDSVLRTANSYSLFSDKSLVNIQYDKKTLDATAKRVLNQCTAEYNPDCLLLIQAPQLTIKSLGTLITSPHLTIVYNAPLTPSGWRAWVTQQLQHAELRFTEELIQRLFDSTRGNSFACAQVIEKIRLFYEPGDMIELDAILPYLTDQCDYQLFELSDACLGTEATHAVRILRHAKRNRQEITFVLWIITQEIRRLIQLKHKQAQGIPLQTACSELNLWSSKVSLYQAALHRSSTAHLSTLLHHAQSIDETIKSSVSERGWDMLERLVIALCQSSNAYLNPRTTA